MLQEIIAIHQRTVVNVPLAFKRYLYHDINWEHRLIGIIGARGTGKTTLVIQYFLEKYNDVEKCLYLSADNPMVLKNGIYNTVSEYFKYYGECVIIDEVHKQPDWSADLKGLYDSFPDKKFIVLGSSMLNILHEKGDLSRRILFYKLKGLSFREYLNFKYGFDLAVVTFEKLLTDHLKISKKLSADIRVLKEFNDYCAAGFYPFCQGLDKGDYYSLLLNIMDKVIYEDIPSLKVITPSSSVKIKKLLGFLCISKIPVCNISSLTNEIGVSKDLLYDFFDILERAEMLNIVRPVKKNVRTMKNSKIFFNNPNLYYAVAAGVWDNEADKGNIRESFTASQLKDILPFNVSPSLDFSVKLPNQVYEIEIGGKNKDNKQSVNIPGAIIFKDGIENGAGNVIPLFLLGLLY